jgi:hypothetical protein
MTSRDWGENIENSNKSKIFFVTIDKLNRLGYLRQNQRIPIYQF